MNWQELVALVDQGEGNAVEFEKQLTSPEDIARELVAFSNCDGGRLIFGIDDKNKHLLGINIDSTLSDWIKDIGSKRCKPTVKASTEILEHEGKNIFIINIPEGDEKPYRTDDLCYIRDGFSSRPAREEEEEEIKSPWGGQGLNKRQKRALHYISEHKSITNREYRELFGISHKTAHIELTMMTDKKLLVSEGMGRSTCYTLPPTQSPNQTKSFQNNPQ